MGYVLWLALDLRPQAHSQNSASLPLFLGACALTFMIFVQVGLGGLMAGTKAGLIFPSFPKFNGEWLPPNLFAMEPLWRNLFENPGVIQLLHRLGAVAVTLAIFMFWLGLASEKNPSPLRKALTHLLPAMVILQFLLGVLTLMGSVGSIPLVRGVLHQGTGIFLFAVAVALTHQFRPEKAG
jgi:cytochrome c oxidase assembly protein subunit 15